MMTTNPHYNRRVLKYCHPMYRDLKQSCIYPDSYSLQIIEPLQSKSPTTRYRCKIPAFARMTVVKVEMTRRKAEMAQVKVEMAQVKVEMMRRTTGATLKDVGFVKERDSMIQGQGVSRGC